MGNPLPLAFLALGVGTLTLSAIQLGWVPAGEGRDVAIVLIGFVFPLQLVAMIFAFLARDGAAAGGIGMIAGHWLVIGLVMISSPPGSTSDALGVFLLGASWLLLVPASASLPAKSLAAAVIAGAALRFAATGIYQLTGSGGWEDVAGIVGLALFVLAFGAGLAMTLTDARGGEAPLPVGRAEGGKPVDADPRQGLDREAGVRPKL
ncbi:MAG TPA: hypothetical protein VFK14_05700 [Solirubrobacterales bacterium]|nr:hypothetical protein [Solirubrobacterales bacterium]